MFIIWDFGDDKFILCIMVILEISGVWLNFLREIGFCINCYDWFMFMGKWLLMNCFGFGRK